MICQKCSYPYASAKGCISCGWVFDPKYHPDLGSAPLEQAAWLLSQPIETLEKLYGRQTAHEKLAVAQKLAQSQPAPAQSAPVQPAPKMPPSVVTATVEPVASPFAAPQPAPEPPPTPPPAEPVDKRKFAKEAKAPTAK